METIYKYYIKVKHSVFLSYNICTVVHDLLHVVSKFSLFEFSSLMASGKKLFSGWSIFLGQSIQAKEGKKAQA